MIDQSNLTDIYERNKVRINLSAKTEKTKNQIYKHYVMLNKAGQKLKKQSDVEFNK